jgi:hypothetical protein
MNFRGSRMLLLNCSAVQVTGSDYVERGNTIQLVCNASGKPDPPHDIEWFHNDDLIRSDSKSGVLITKKIEARFLVSTLSIRNSRLSDSGDYMCRTSGRDFASINVNVLNGQLLTIEVLR